MTSVDPPPYEASQQRDASVNVQIPPSRATAPIRKGNWKRLRVTGYMQVGLGLVTVLFGLISIVYKTSLYFVGNPIWTAVVFFIPTGIIGVAAGGKRKIMVGFYLAASIIAACFACAVIILHGVSIGLERFCPDDTHRETGVHFYIKLCSSSTGTRITIDSLIILTAIVEMIVAIVGACLTCSSLCQPTSPTVVTYHSPQQILLAGQPQGAIHYTVPPQQQFGNLYPAHVVQAPVGSVQYQPQGQIVYQPGIAYPPQPQVQGQFQQGPQVVPGQFQPGPAVQGPFQPVPPGLQAQTKQHVTLPPNPGAS